MHTRVIGMIFYALFAVAALSDNLTDDVFLKLAKSFAPPEASAAAFVSSIEKQMQTSGEVMSSACRLELLALMTKASVERLETTEVLQREGKALREHFNAADASSISTFLEADIGRRLMKVMNAVATGQAQSDAEKKELIQSLFSAEEWRQCIDFLQSSAGQLFQSKLPAINADLAKVEAEFEKQTMTILKGYSERINAIMKKHGH